MIVLDENGKEIKDYKVEDGKLENVTQPVYFYWVVDSPEVSHEEIIKEYPNGSKDAKIVIDQAERGHWEVKDKSGKKLTKYDGGYPEGKGDAEMPLIGEWIYDRLVKRTPEEQAEFEKQQLEAEHAVSWDDMVDAIAELGMVVEELANG